MRAPTVGVVDGAGVERHLLADDRREVGVEGEHELLEAACSLGGRLVAEHGGAEEAEDGVDAAVVQEAEAAHLVARCGRCRRWDGTAGMPNMPTFW